MGLISNSNRNGFSPFKWGYGNTLSYLNGGNALRNGYLPGKIHNWSWHATRQTALPNGNLHPYSWMLPRTGGGMSMRITASGTLTANLIPEKSMSIDFTGSGDLDATASLIKAMICAMTGSGTLEASIAGVLSASADFTGSGDLDAQLYGIAQAVLSLTGSGDLSADISGIGNMSIDIVVTGTGLSTANVGKYVWEALVAQFATDPESAAAKLLAAGSAGDPWSTDLPASYTGTQAGNIVAQIQTLVERLHRIQGLEVGVPSTTDRNTGKWIAGDIELDISGDLVNETTIEAVS